MAVQNTALLVFLFPVVISIGFGTFVLSDVLNQPDRKLNMWPFENLIEPPVIKNEDIKIQNLLERYSTSMQIEVKIVVNNSDFDCGDLYITVYDVQKSPKEVVLQNGFFSQCFSENNLSLPIGDSFSEKIDKAGKYEMVAELSDKNYHETITATAKFEVK